MFNANFKNKGDAMSIETITKTVESEMILVARVFDEIGKIIIGQRHLIEGMLIGLFANGHILVEGVPGLAKTTAVKTLSRLISAAFQRIQFTPDLLPADVIGTQIYYHQESAFRLKKGPVFTQILLADEINRAPAKVQSALLEAMQERQVTIGEQTFVLEKPFLVMATQNPIEQQGVYPLPEAQVDRFMLKLKVSYPKREEEIKIMKTHQEVAIDSIQPIMTVDDILRIQALMQTIYMDDRLYDYIADLVIATREPERYGLKDLKNLIEYGASPRASIYLAIAAKAYAFLQGRGFVTPQDIKSVGIAALRHRVIVSYEAEARDKTSDDIILSVLDRVDVP
jgi:MoxR-like ATPase